MLLGSVNSRMVGKQEVVQKPVSSPSKTKFTLNVGAIVFPLGHSPDFALQLLLDVSTTVKRAGGL